MNAITPINLAIREREDMNDAAEAMWEVTRQQRKDEACEAVKDPDELKTILNDEWLAYGLARQQSNLERAIYELTKLQVDYRVPDDAMISLRGLIQATVQIERDLFSRKLDELEDA